MTTKNKKEEWRSLCELVTQEHDPQRLSELIGQLTKALDARSRATSANNNRRKPAPTTAPDPKSRK
jgi:hypothetical protein